MDDREKIVVIGAGALGTLFAGMLVRNGCDIAVIERDEDRVHAIRENGLIIEADDATTTVVAASIDSDPRVIGHADIIMLFVKAYDTGDAVRSIETIITEDTAVVTLQNGLGNVEQIAQVVHQECIVAGTTAHGAHLLGPGRVRHAGRGDTVIGPLVPEGSERAEKVAAILCSAGIPVLRSDAVMSVIWSKLLINAAINPLTALMGVPNGMVVQNRYLCDIVQNIIDEITRVADREGISIVFDDPFAKVEEVASATSRNISSMLQDIRNKRRTEIDYINGAVVAWGLKNNVPTPYNRMMVEMVKAMEAVIGVRSANNDKNIQHT